MSTTQQIATGFLALIIVGSIALMPVSAGSKAAKASPPAPSGNMMATLNTPENPPQEQVKDLTYN